MRSILAALVLSLGGCSDGLSVRLTIDTSGVSTRPNAIELFIFGGNEQVGATRAPEQRRELGESEDLVVVLPASTAGQNLVALLDVRLDETLLGSGEATFTPVDGQSPGVTIVVGTARWCGDGLLRAPLEACDDGNMQNGDGCGATCENELRVDGGLPDAAKTGDAGFDGGTEEPEPVPDAGLDAGVDARIDAGADAGVDGGSTGGLDAGVDAGTDAGPTYPLDYLAHWPLDGDGAEATGTYTGQLAGLTRHVRGAHGGGLYFAGSDDYIDIGLIPELASGDALTVAAWFRDDEGSSSRQILGTNPPGELDFVFGRSSDHMYFDLGVDVDSFWRWLEYADLAPQGRWQHVAVTYDGTQPEGFRSRLFHDGVEVPFTLIVPFPPAHGDLSGEPFYLSDPGANAWLGVLDDVFVYQRALAAPEILSLFERGRPPVPNDYHHRWNFEGGATDITDGTTGTTSGSVSFAVDGLTGTGAGLNNGIGEISLRALPDLNQPSRVSVSLWLRDEGATADVRYLFSIEQDPLHDFSAWLGGPGDDNLHIDVGNGEDSRVSVGQFSALLPPSAWTHLVIVYDGALLQADRVRVFVDGSPAVVDAANGIVPVSLPDLSTVPLVLGREPFPTNAVLDDLVIYRRSLDADEVARLAAPPPSTD